MKNFPEAHDLIHESSMLLVQYTVGHLKGALDKEFGPDFSKNNPETLASLVQATMTGYAGALVAAAIQDASKKMA